jgi:acetolactate synthase-1/2/3 large subunit
VGDELPITAGGAIFRRLHQLGVSRVFVNSGTDFPPIIEGLAEAEHVGLDLPDVMVVPHEHLAVSMAHGHYFATGEPAAVILHTNVGLANGAIGAINAATDHVPIILMSGRTPTLERERFGARTVPIGWGQEMRDQTALVREACKWDYEIRFPEQVPELLDRAHAIATSTPKGPVYLSLPREVLCEACPAEELARPPGMAAAIGAARDDDIARAAWLLARADHPLIIAQRGAGSASGFAALADIADRYDIPVCQWWASANAISSDHPMYVGSNPSPWIDQADVVVVLDSLAPWMPDAHPIGADARVVQIGPNPLYSRFPVRNFRSNVSIASELGPALVALSAALDRLDADGQLADRSALRASVAAHAAERGAAAAAAADVIDGPMTKSFVGHVLGQVLRDRDARVVSELGVPLDAYAPTAHQEYRQEPHSGGLGWSLPCAMGMKLAEPDRLVVATMGDGSYMFANPVAAHHTCEAHGIAVLTVVVNNHRYGAVSDSVTGMYPTGYAAKADAVPLTELSPSPDFRLVAESCRAWAETVTDPSELRAAIERAIAQVEAGRQAVLDVHIE